MGARVFTDLDALNRGALEELLRAWPAGEPSQYPAGIIKPEGGSLWFFGKAAEG
jgi:hypothetical protein